jgi:hypothetical protein
VPPLAATSFALKLDDGAPRRISRLIAAVGARLDEGMVRTLVDMLLKAGFYRDQRVSGPYAADISQFSSRYSQ